MVKIPKSIEKAIKEYTRLPGIGPKSAARIVFHLLMSPETTLNNIVNSMVDLKKVNRCILCYNYCEGEYCSICTDSGRDRSTLLVIENTLDLIAFEQSGYTGIYHILGGLLSPLHGVGPSDLAIKELSMRVKSSEIKDIVFALPTSLEGDATVNYIRKYLEENDLVSNVGMFTLAKGLPSNSGIDYQDPDTLKYSMINKQRLIS